MKKKSNRTRLVLVGVGILLILLGLRGIALAVIGKTAQATVTEVQQTVSQQDDSMDHNYQISYRFRIDGKDYTGSFTRKKVYNTATLPSVGSAVSIRYLPAAPSVNGGPDAGPVGGLVLGCWAWFCCFSVSSRPRPPRCPYRRRVLPRVFQNDSHHTS